MKFERKDMLDLNEENVNRIYSECLANKETKDPMRSNFLEKQTNTQIPDVVFSFEKLKENLVTIHYLFGQLEAVHACKLHLDLLDGYSKYDSSIWTTNKSVLFELYHLGTSVYAVPYFRHSADRKTFVSPIHGQLHLKPTPSPADPVFPIWLEKYETGQINWEESISYPFGRKLYKFKKEDRLDLNEENVKKVFNYCLANKETKDPFKAEFLKETQNMKLPNIFMSKQKINEKVWTIRYLLCQLAAIHEGKNLLPLLDGYRKYDGTNWTENKGTLFMLYYLASSTSTLPLFKPYPERKTYVSSIYAKQHLKPTLSPADPDFPDWLKKNGLEQA